MMEWILTYAVHSTALIAAVWLLTSMISRLSLGTRETLWKVALLGPLATATVVTVSGAPSLWGPMPVPEPLRTQPMAVAPAVAPAASPTEAPVVERRIVHHRTGELEITAVRQRQSSAVAAPVSPPATATAAAQPAKPSPWPLVLLALWGVGAAAALGRLGWAMARLRKQLKGRRDVVEDPVLESFLEMCSKAGLKKRPRLTASAHLRSPIALGRREICLPERAVDSLSPQQQQGMLAHEMAHLLRYDPVWSVAIAVIEAVFFFQPLNHLARRKIQEVAEYQCDDWAASQSGTGVHLAKCLAEVAGWVEDGPPASPAVVAMADRGSPIVRRITRLLHQRRSGGRVHPVGRVALTVGSLGLVIAAVPGVSHAETTAEPVSAKAAEALVVARAEGQLQGVIFEDYSDSGHDRSRVRLKAGDEVVEIEIQAPRPVPPPPPPAPPVQEERVEIMILGQFGGYPWWGGGWFGGMLGLGGFEMIVPAVPLGWSEGLHHRGERRRTHAHERAERARERADRRRERALGRLESEIEREVERELSDAVWPSIFGVSLESRAPSKEERSVVIEL